MDRTDCAVLINTCPKFFYLLEAHFGLLRRYAPSLKWPVYLATEDPHNPQIKRLAKKYEIRILPLELSESDFLESRYFAVKRLPAEIRYILPLQEDFLLERPGPDPFALKHALELLDTDPQVQSLRLMPCPGASAKEPYKGPWKQLAERDMIFSYQATIWRRELYTDYMARLIQDGRSQHPEFTSADWNRYCIRVNPAETHPGFFLLKSISPTGIHLCWPRSGPYANAVYQCPWPYRPTAVVQGILQPFAQELIWREGFVVHESKDM
jgi:hypothetical protein